VLVALSLLVGGCLDRSAPPAYGKQDPATCGGALDIPLAQMAVDPRPVGPPAGGPIADGAYDLVALVATAGDPHGASPQTGMRLQMRFVTDLRAPDHTEGRLFSLGGMVPQTECEVGRFATLGNVLRLSGVKSGGGGYSAIPNGFIVFLDPNHGRYDPSYMVFRRH
jgi:hypothetical protein